MDLLQLVNRFETSDWLSEFSHKCPPAAPSRLSYVDLALLMQKAKENLKKGRVGHALNWVSLGLYLDPSSVVAQIQRNGLLRSSKYQYQSKPLSGLLDHLLKRREALRVPADSARYLESVRSFLTLSEAALRTYWLIVRELRKREKFALKSLVAVVDLLFLKPRPAARQSDADNPEFYTIEEYAEALSFLVHTFATLRPIEDRHFNLVDERGIAQGVYDRLLMAACKLQVYHEAELLLDTFSYSAVHDGGVVQLVPRDRRLEQSIRLGYIQSDFHKAVTLQRHLGGTTEAAASLRDMTQQVYAAHGNKLVQRVEHPIPRYILAIPEAPELFEPFRGNGLFMEDITYLHAVAREQYARPEDVLGFKLAEGLTLFDVVKIQRLLNFMRGLMAGRLLPLLETETVVALRSLLPVFRKDKLQALLSLCVSAEAASTFLRITTYSLILSTFR